MAVIYLAGPIDRSEDHEWEIDISRTVRAVWDKVTLGPCTIYSPLNAWKHSLLGSMAIKEASVIMATNMSIVKNCDAVLMAYIEGTETWGCPMEAAWAMERHVPVFVWSRGDGTSEDSFKRLPTHLAAIAHEETLFLSSRSATDAMIGFLRDQMQRTELSGSFPNDNIIQAIIGGLERGDFL